MLIWLTYARPNQHRSPRLPVARAGGLAPRHPSRQRSADRVNASYTGYPPLTAPSGQCTPVDFSIRGCPQAPLIGGDFAKQLGNTVGVSLAGG